MGGWLSLFLINNNILHNGYALDSHCFGNLLIDTLIAIFGTLAVLLSCNFIIQKSRYAAILGFFGKNSMAFYGVQAIMVGVLNTSFRHFIDEEILFSSWGYVISFFSLLISLLVDSMLVRLYDNKIKRIIIR